MNTFKQSAIKILKKSKIPLHYNEITKFSNCDQSKLNDFSGREGSLAHRPSENSRLKPSIFKRKMVK